MSVNNNDIQGSASVSRNANIGGDATVRGSTFIDHNLFVKGWVDAPNIKGPLKGLYASEETLKAAYPRPEPGWFALVGDTLPADVWRADRVDESYVGWSYGRVEWIPTGEKGGEFNLWLDQLESDVREARANIAELKESLGTAWEKINSNSEAIRNTNTKVARIETALDRLHTNLENLKEKYAAILNEYHQLNLKYTVVLQNLEAVNTELENLKAKVLQLQGGIDLTEATEKEIKEIAQNIFGKGNTREPCFGVATDKDIKDIALGIFGAVNTVG